MSKNIYLLLTPTYGSMGDQAIAYAEEYYLKRTYPQDKVIVLNEVETLSQIQEISQTAHEADVFFLQGGGNLGSLYPEVEDRRRKVIRQLGERCITIFPQSVFFQNNIVSDDAVSVYSRKTVTIYAREPNSYYKMKYFFPLANVKMKPDIVYTLYDRFHSLPYDRDRIIISFRSDKESIYLMDRQIITDAILEKYPDSEIVSMYSNCEISREKRSQFVVDSILRFGNAKAIITDRLHGCIFAAITKTPCIFFPNSYGKNEGNYHWLRALNYILFTDSHESDTIITELDQLLKLDEKEKTDLIMEDW